MSALIQPSLTLQQIVSAGMAGKPTIELALRDMLAEEVRASDIPVERQEEAEKQVWNSLIESHRTSIKAIPVKVRGALGYPAKATPEAAEEHMVKFFGERTPVVVSIMLKRTVQSYSGLYQPMPDDDESPSP